jgi:NadR type nicotinamide-nucleotide adenylyltransferase
MKKIVVIGPESTGKSTLCERLADHYATGWAKEYAREYLLKHGTQYSFDDLLHIAQNQLRLEEEGLAAVTKKLQDAGRNSDHLPFFIDTDMQVMKVWCEVVFYKTHNWILNRITERQYDLYLLCNVDIPWVKDELREYPDLESRVRLYHHYRDTMINQSTPWVDISGTYDERLQKAIQAVDAII